MRQCSTARAQTESLARIYIQSQTLLDRINSNRGKEKSKKPFRQHSRRMTFEDPADYLQDFLPSNMGCTALQPQQAAVWISAHFPAPGLASVAKYGDELFIKNKTETLFKNGLFFLFANLLFILCLSVFQEEVRFKDGTWF